MGMIEHTMVVDHPWFGLDDATGVADDDGFVPIAVHFEGDLTLHENATRHGDERLSRHD